jgi:hypothetical protein
MAKARRRSPPESGDPVAAAAPNMSQSGPHGRRMLSQPSEFERRWEAISERSFDFRGMRRSSPEAIATRTARKIHGAKRRGPASRRVRKPRPIAPQSIPVRV